MEGTTERAAELKKAAIACGLEPEQAIDDVAEACGTAEQAVSSLADIKLRLARWWPAFFKDYSIRCVSRWQEKYGNLRDYQEMERLWLEYFEPMWLAGCNFAKDIASQNMKGGYNKVVSKHAITDREALEKLKLYYNSVTDNFEKVISSEIEKFTSIQREVILKTFRGTR